MSASSGRFFSGMFAGTALRRALNMGSARLHTLPCAGQQQSARSLSSQRKPPEVLRLDGAHPRARAVLTYWCACAATSPYETAIPVFGL